MNPFGRSHWWWRNQSRSKDGVQGPSAPLSKPQQKVAVKVDLVNKRVEVVLPTDLGTVCFEGSASACRELAKLLIQAADVVEPLPPRGEG